jgi:hypothetical protein
MMMADIAKFSMIGLDKLEDDTIGSVDPEVPYVVMRWMQLLHMERRVKGIGSEPIGLCCGFALDGFGKLV